MRHCMCFGLVSAACGLSSSFGYLSLKGCLFNWARALQKPTKWLVHPAKTLIRLGISPVWSESLLSALREARGPELSSGEQQGLWSDWADAQADLSLHWPQMSFCWFYYMMAQLFSDNPVKSSRVVVPDQLPCFVVSYLGFHALPKSVDWMPGLNGLKFVES